MDSHLTNPKIEEIHNKHKRRTRNESTLDRNFTCGCGKSYLSYPALYLHLKNKHDGKAPDGTILPNTNMKGSRGRPKKEESQDLASSNFDSTDEALDEFVNWLNNLGRYFKREEKVNIQSPEFLENLIQEFPFEFLPNENDYKPIIENIQLIYQKNEEGIQDIDQSLEEFEEREHDSIKKTKCNKIFAIFLIRISKFVTFACLKELAYFICLYRKVLNLIGWEFLSKIKPELKIEQLKDKNEYCEINSGEYILEICNDFIIDYLPKLLSDLQDKNLTLLGLTDTQMKYAVHLTQHFSNWLYNNNFTNSKLVISTEIENEFENKEYSDIQKKNEFQM